MPDISVTPEKTDTTRREHLLRDALTLFAERGYAGTSVKAIAQRAGVSQGLLYVHFENKEALLLALFEREMRDVQGTLAAGAAGVGTEALEALLRSTFKTVTANRDLWRLSYALRFQPAVSALLEPLIGAWTASIREQLEEVCRGMNLARPELEARLLFATIDGACQHAVLEPDYPVEAVITTLLDRYRLVAAQAIDRVGVA